MTLRKHADAADPRPQTVVELARVVHPRLGSRQAEVVGLLEPLYPGGISAGQLSRAMDYDEPNVHLTLNDLVKRGIVEKDADVRPHLYRLSPDIVPSDGED